MSKSKKIKQVFDTQENQEFDREQRKKLMTKPPVSIGIIATGLALSGGFAIAKLLPKLKKLDLPSLANRENLVNPNLKSGVQKASSVVTDLFSSASSKFRKN